MPLSPPVPRELVHTRDIVVRGYRRADGLFDIEAELADRRNHPFATPDRGTIAVGEKLHGMVMRMTVDEDMQIIESVADTEFGPFLQCAGGAETYGRLAGLTIRPGFLKAANERLGGTAGCTHLRELLQQMATIALQTVLSGSRAGGAGDPRSSAGAARLLNTCHAYASDGPVVKRRWPALYTGPDAMAEATPRLATATPDS
jgi:hypothetical protein